MLGGGSTRDHIFAYTWYTYLLLAFNHVNPLVASWSRTCRNRNFYGFSNFSWFFPKQVYLWGSILEKNTLDTLVGALGLVGRGFGPAGRAGLGWAWGLAVLGALACAGWCGVGPAGRVAGLGVVSLGWVRRGVWPAGRAGWVGRGVGWVGRGVGRGVWPCWARWLGWACWAWGLAVVGALGWVGRGVWPCWARWLGWAWCSK